MTATVLPPAAFGVYGNTSTACLARIGSWALDDVSGVSEVPDVGLIYIGVNDPIASISQATTQLNIQTMILAAKFGAYGEKHASSGAYVASQTTLPATGRIGQRIVVQADSSTTGGAAGFGPKQTAVLTGDYSGSPRPAVWECRRGGGGGEINWGRIATSSTAPTHCKRVVVVSANYKNYSTDGTDSTAAGAAGKRDTTSTPEPFYAQVRAAQQAAVTAENVTVNGKPSVVYADLYNLQRTFIVGGTFPSTGTLTYTAAAGTVPDFSGGATYAASKDWHVGPSNQHHGLFGHWLVALAAHLAIVNAGWATDLKALTAPVNIKIIGDSQTDYNAGFCRASRTWAPTLGQLLGDHLASLA